MDRGHVLGGLGAAFHRKRRPAVQEPLSWLTARTLYVLSQTKSGPRIWLCSPGVGQLPEKSSKWPPTLPGDEAGSPARARASQPGRQNVRRFSRVVWEAAGAEGVKGRGDGQERVRTARGREGSGELRDFITQTRGQVSSAPGLRSWERMPGSRGQREAGPHPRQLSFLFLIHAPGGHTVPSLPPPPHPPDRRTCFSA